jgi:hypothetical protein
MTVVWLGWAGSRGMPSWWSPQQPTMISAGGMWWTARGKFVRRRWRVKRRCLFIDSGGFYFMHRSGDYPFSPDDYNDLIWHYKPAIAACLDYPYEPEIRRDHKLRTNKDRILATVDHSRYLFKLVWPSETLLLPVIQGYSLDEYLWCIEEMARVGIPLGRVGIGSMCRRLARFEIRYLVRNILDQLNACLPHSERVWTHWFGLKLSALANPALRGVLDSCDTAAWSMGHDEGVGRYCSRDVEEARFRRYKGKVETMLRQPTQLPLKLM